MGDGKGPIPDAVKGAGSYSDHMVITPVPLSNTKEMKIAKILIMSFKSGL